MPERIRKGRRKSFFLRVLFIFLGLAALLVGLSFASRIPAALVKETTVVGNEVVSSDDVVRVVEGELSGRYLRLFSKRNVFLLRKSRITALIKKDFPRFEDASLSIIDTNHLVVRVLERKGRYLWCEGAYPIAPDTAPLSCFFVDDRGYIFSEAPYFSGNAYLKLYGGIKEDGDMVGKNILSEAAFKNILNAYNGLKAIGLSPEVISNSPPEILEAYLEHSIDSQSSRAKIIFSLYGSSEDAVANISAALHAEDFKNSYKAHPEKLEYIDTRYEKKVYYKFTK